MRKHKLFASPVIANVFAAALTTSAALIASHVAFAADACLSRPDLRAEQGGHWYYRVDRVNHRRCWYQQASASELREARPAPAAQNLNPVAPASPVTSLLASIAALVTGKTASTATPDAATRTPPLVDATSERPLNRRSRVAKRAEPDKHAEPDNSFASRYPNFGRAESTTVVEESRAAPPSSPVWSQEQERAPLDAVTREALFQEFLRWQERRNNVVW
jgi:hypothetical protein